MFRSLMTIIRELVLHVAKAALMLKHSVKLRRYILCDDVAACCHITECFNVNITLARCCTNSTMTVIDRNMQQRH